MLMDEDAPLGAMPGSRHGANPEPIRRFEILTGVGRRRSFAVDEKLALVAQMAGCANISELARRHDLRPSQLFTWRRELRYAAEAVQAAAPEPMFVPPPMVALPGNLLQPPPSLPQYPRNPDGTMSGGQCLAGSIDLYAAAGAMRLQILALIAAEKARKGK